MLRAMSFYNLPAEPFHTVSIGASSRGVRLGRFKFVSGSGSFPVRDRRSRIDFGSVCKGADRSAGGVCLGADIVAGGGD